MITVIGIPNCDQIKKTLSWLNEHQVAHTFVDVKKEPLTRDEIAELAFKVSFDTLVNRKGTTWKKLSVQSSLTDEQLLELVLHHQTLIKRPVLVSDDGAVLVGFDEDALRHFTEET